MIQRKLGDLTKRELEVLALVAMGRSNKEIARAFVISEATVENHLTHIYRKWYVTNRTEAAYYSHRLGQVV